MMPEVLERTTRAVEEVEALSAASDSAGAERAAAAREEIDAIASRWLREMEALGVEVKGAWLVDFDNGSGYYCWKWPEERLEHFHGYDEGFAARVRIQ
jgi:hypothetical protein